MEETISLREIYLVIKKRWYLILSTTLIATLISAFISFFLLTPIYEAKTQILINQNDNANSSVQMSDIQADITLVNTYNVIIKSPAILKEVIKELELTETVEQLQGKITVSNEQNSQVINIVVQDPDILKAVEIANGVASVFKDEISNLMNIDNVSVLAETELNPNQSPVKPNPLLNIAIAIVLGAMIGIGIAFLLEYLDNTIKNEVDIKKALDIPVLGVVTDMSKTPQQIKKRR